MNYENFASVSPADSTVLSAQHTLQSQDFLLICQLAQVDNILEKVSSWSFEQFLGFTLYQFITTDAASTREQLADVLPKFGSHVVLPLVKIARHFEINQGLTQDSIEGGSYIASDVRFTALKVLGHMNPEVLVAGLQPVFQHPQAQQLLPIVVKVILEHVYRGQAPIISYLSQYLSQESWRCLSLRLLDRVSGVSCDLSQADAMRNAVVYPKKARVIAQ